MRTRTPLALAAAAAALAAGAGLASPASATVTHVSVAIDAGSLSITVPVTTPATPVDLGSLPVVDGGKINGSLGQVQVLDNRNASAGASWVASVISTAFAPPAGPAIGAANVGYIAGAITAQGTVTLVANNPPDLTGVTAAVTASAITGNNSATWNPTIEVTVPGGLASGIYTGMITHSVA